MPETGTVEEKSEEGFEVFKVAVLNPVRFQTEPTGLGYSAHHFFLKLTPMVRLQTELTGFGGT